MKLDCCDRCEYCAHSPYLVCAEHPGGVEGDSCKDFKLATRAIAPSDDPLAWYNDQWHPEGASYYGDELILEPVQRRSLEEQLDLLDNHPLFTGRCPRCESAIAPVRPGQVHYDCEHCGWADDSM